MRCAKFAADSSLEEAVRSELVSESQFPVIQGKYREIHRRRPYQLESEVEIVFIIKCLPGKFPTQWNRELIGLYQGIKSAHQGKFPPEQGSPPFWFEL